MSNVSEFSTTAASNNSASPNGFPESMAPSGVNDSARELMASLAKWYKDTQGTITTGGTTTAYTLTTNNAHAALNDIPLFAMQINAANTGSATLNVDSLGAKTMKLAGANLRAGDLAADEIVLVVYNPDNDVYDIFKSGSVPPGIVLLQTVAASNDATIDLGEGGQITSAYSEYIIELINVIPATDAQNLLIRTSSDTGSNYDGGASDYKYSLVEAGTEATATTTSILVTQAVASGANETGVCATVRLFNPSASTYTSIAGHGMSVDGSGVVAFNFGGVRQSAGVVDAIRFLFASGNVESGTFKLYGVR